jgi:hypothetical protein
MENHINFNWQQVTYKVIILILFCPQLDYELDYAIAYKQINLSDIGSLTDDSSFPNSEKSSSAVGNGLTSG